MEKQAWKERAEAQAGAPPAGSEPPGLAVTLPTAAGVGASSLHVTLEDPRASPSRPHHGLAQTAPTWRFSQGPLIVGGNTRDGQGGAPSSGGLESGPKGQPSRPSGIGQGRVPRGRTVESCRAGEGSHDEGCEHLHLSPDTRSTHCCGQERPRPWGFPQAAAHPLQTHKRADFRAPSRSTEVSQSSAAWPTLPAAACVMGGPVTGVSAPGWPRLPSTRCRVAVQRNPSTCS